MEDVRQKCTPSLPLTKRQTRSTVQALHGGLLGMTLPERKSKNGPKSTEWIMTSASNGNPIGEPCIRIANEAIKIAKLYFWLWCGCSDTFPQVRATVLASFRCIDNHTACMSYRGLSRLQMRVWSQIAPLLKKSLQKERVSQILLLHLPCLSGLIHIFICNTKIGEKSDMTKSWVTFCCSGT